MHRKHVTVHGRGEHIACLAFATRCMRRDRLLTIALTQHRQRETLRSVLLYDASGLSMDPTNWTAQRQVRRIAAKTVRP